MPAYFVIMNESRINKKANNVKTCTAIRHVKIWLDDNLYINWKINWSWAYASVTSIKVILFQLPRTIKFKHAKSKDLLQNVFVESY